MKVRVLVVGVTGAIAVTLAALFPTVAAPLPDRPVHLDNPFKPAFQNNFGQQVASAGDIDGDGDDEVLVGGITRNERVALYLGSPAGLSRSPVVLEEPPGAVAFGISLGSAGDVNADGFDDVVIGGYHEMHLYLGSRSGLGDPVRFSPSSSRGTEFGSSLAPAGDVDGDGFDDVIVGDWQWDGQLHDQGAAYLYRGSPSGLRRGPDRLSPTGQAGAEFGYSVSSAGDVNRDGYGDVLIGAPGWRSEGFGNEGRVYVYLGSARGLTRPPHTFDASNQRDAGFGFSVASAGDVNGDHFDDLLVGAKGWSGKRSYVGRVYVYLGARKGPRGRPLTRNPVNQSNSGFGLAVAGAGDLDDDGFDDIVVGAPSEHADKRGEGRAYIYRGSADGLARRPAVREPSNAFQAHFGDVVVAAGDVNDDGVADLAISAPEHPVELFHGRVYVYYRRG